MLGEGLKHCEIKMRQDTPYTHAHTPDCIVDKHSGPLASEVCVLDNVIQFSTIESAQTEQHCSAQES